MQGGPRCGGRVDVCRKRWWSFGEFGRMVEQRRRSYARGRTQGLHGPNNECLRKARGSDKAMRGAAGTKGGKGQAAKPLQAVRSISLLSTSVRERLSILRRLYNESSRGEDRQARATVPIERSPGHGVEGHVVIVLPASLSASALIQWT